MTKAHDARKAERQEESRQKLIETLKLDLEARGGVWDESCCLCFLYEDDDGTWHISALNLPREVWQPHPAAGLAHMAAGISSLMGAAKEILKLTSSIKPASWRGVAFFSESWLVEQEKKPDEKLDPIFEEMAKARMLSQHPAREEARCWWAQLADGTAVSVVLKRESGDWQTGIFLRSAGGKDKPRFEGAIPASLETLTEILSRA